MLDRAEVERNLDRVRWFAGDGGKWCKREDFLLAIHAPPRAWTLPIPQGMKKIIREQRGMYIEAKVMYIAPEAAERLAIEYANCPNAWIRAWLRDTATEQSGHKVQCG